MLIEQLDALVKAEPFEPFTLHMADGRSQYVSHPEWISISPTRQTVILYHPDNSFSLINLNLVKCLVRMKGKQRRSRKHGNGSH